MQNIQVLLKIMHSLAAEVLDFRAAVVQLMSMKTCVKNKFGC